MRAVVMKLQGCTQQAGLMPAGTRSTRATWERLHAGYTVASMNARAAVLTLAAAAAFLALHAAVSLSFFSSLTRFTPQALHKVLGPVECQASSAQPGEAVIVLAPCGRPTWKTFTGRPCNCCTVAKVHRDPAPSCAPLPYVEMIAVLSTSPHQLDLPATVAFELCHIECRSSVSSASEQRSEV